MRAFRFDGNAGIEPGVAGGVDAVQGDDILSFFQSCFDVGRDGIFFDAAEVAVSAAVEFFSVDVNGHIVIVPELENEVICRDLIQLERTSDPDGFAFPWSGEIIAPSGTERQLTG